VATTRLIPTRQYSWLICDVARVFSTEMSSHCTVQGLKGLLQTLTQYLDRELDLWIPITHVNCQKLMTSEQRSDLVDWLIELNKRFCFSAETLFLSVDIFDRFLHIVKAQSKYLRCIAVTCLYIGAKINEEDDVIPATQELVHVSECGCSEAEILRMERCILNKFDWSPRASPTSVEFIHLFHALVLNKCPMLVHSADELDVTRCMLDEALLLCLHRSELLEYPPSTVALSILSIYLEFTWTQWKFATQRLQALIQLSEADLSECRQLTTRCLGSHLVNFTMNKKTALLKTTPQFFDQPSFLSSNFTSSLSPHSNSTHLKSAIIAQSCSEESRGDEVDRENIGSVIRKEMTPPPSIPVTPNPPSKRRRVEQDDDVYDDIRKLYNTDDVTSSQCDVIGMSCGMEVSSCHGNGECVGGIVTLLVPIATV